MAGNITVSAEEFYELKRKLSELEEQVNRLAASHKDVLEKYLPELANRAAEHISHSGELYTQQMSKLAEVANGMKSLVDIVDKRFEALEAVVYDEQ